jgi:hypothetical protein
VVNSPAKLRTVDVDAATELLRRMMSELHSLRATTSSPRLAIAIDAHEAREQLHELFEAVCLLTRELQLRHAAEVTSKVLSLIKRLAGELEYLTCEAQRDQHELPPGCDCSGMAN